MGDLIRSLTGDRLWVNSVAWSPDGSLLAGGTQDNTIKLWATDTGAVVRTLVGAAPVAGLAWSANGCYLLSGWGDASWTMLIWGSP